MCQEQTVVVFSLINQVAPITDIHNQDTKIAVYPLFGMRLNDETPVTEIAAPRIISQ